MTDTSVSIHPYFNVPTENLSAFNAIIEELIGRAKTEADCLYYGFSYNGNLIHCREGYRNAEGLLFHLNNVGDLIEKAMGISEMQRLEIHGSATELEKLKAPLAELPAEYYELKSGFRK
ncbi:hypothetical protein [Pelagicoccus sp. SDUM812002]|uniref:putative quinol monooxygenase n=1 Tax=Pelagicoccus sp. SDUM812002 TaxID=3041266 RepID=UPI00280CFFB0|nr:hypothetical protein [Pelagicoccus sp. SDUM812002]MDQ8184965.1 hypothetical protein [Pelagicoccus sp. SDUM812002]